LGSHEAPPAIISIFLGDQLEDIIEQIEKGGAKTSKKGGVLEIGVDSLPQLPRDATDRNRTSPFAFTGAKFEFRAVGSNANLAGPNIVLNTIVADVLDGICATLEADKKAKKDFNASIQNLLKSIIKKHKRIIFNGDNYTEAWVKEAKKRGLPNLKNTSEALEVLKKPEVSALFERQEVLTKKELNSRYEVYKETYEIILDFEGRLSADMAKTMILPGVIEYQDRLAETIKSVESINKTKAVASRRLLKEITKQTELALVCVEKLEVIVKKGDGVKIKEAMEKLRAPIDALEGLVPADIWPLPSYAEMLFVF